jgi:hypothetical protein
MRAFIKILLLLLSASVGYLLFSLLRILHSSSYNEFIHWVAEGILRKPHLVKFIPAYFDESRFSLLQSAVIFVTVIYSFLLLWLFKRRTTVVNGLTDNAEKSIRMIKSFFVSVQPRESSERAFFWMITGSSFLIAAYNVFTIPISYDEAGSYTDFVSKGPLVISTLYHTTNNHILSNMISYISCLILPKGEIGQRMPLLFILLVNCFLFFGLLKRMVKPYQALIGLAFFAASTPVYLYSFMARGYSLVILFMLICLLAVRQLVLSPERKYWVVLFLASVLGTYSIPVMVYLLLPLYLYMGVVFFKNNKKQLKPLLLTGFLSGVAVGFLYTPVFLVSGLTAIKQVVSDISTKRTLLQNTIRNFEVFTNFYISSTFLLKIALGVPVLLGIVHAYSNYRKSGSTFLLFLLIVAPMPLSVSIILGQGMFDRTWIFMTIVLAILYAFAFARVKQKAVLSVAIVVTFGLQLFSSVNARYYVSQKHHIFTARKTADYFAAQKMESIYLDHQYLRPMMEYRLQLLQYPYQLYVKKSQFQKSDFDPNKKYSLIVYAEGSATPSSNYHYRLIDSVKEIRVLELVPE